MNDSETLDAIITHGLSVRQIPPHVVETLPLSSHKEGNEIISVPIPVATGQYLTRKAWFLKHTREIDGFVFDDTALTIHRKFTKEIRVPKNAGFWMCQKVSNTNSMVKWDLKHHHLAPTLHESVELYLSRLTP